MDFVVLRPLDAGLWNFIGTEFCANSEPWCTYLPEVKEREGFVFGLNESLFILNTAFMSFDPGHPILTRILTLFDEDYDPERWNCNPYFASLVTTRNKAEVFNPNSPLHFRIIEPSGFYPLPWWKIHIACSQELDLLWVLIKETSYAIHMFGKLSASLPIVPGSLASHVYQEFALSDYPL